MSYKNILVHLDENRNVEATLQATCRLAKTFDAHVSGIYVIPHLTVPVYAETSYPESLLAAQEEAAMEKAKLAQSQFEKVVNAEGLLSEWAIAKGYPDEEIIQHGKYADLIVMGQSGNLTGSAVSHTIENHVLLGSARPVLVVPYIGFTGSLTRRVMVAWDGSKESTRAVNDAMPVLREAQNVEVISITRSSEHNEVPSSDMCVYLARHGVTAEASKMLKGALSTSNILLNRVSDRSIDLIVMGAYGHSRLRELVLGGATYNILRHMTVPVFMSH